MDSQSRLKIKIGENIFEAEGSPEEIRDQYRMFIELVGSMPTAAPLPPQIQASEESGQVATPAPPPNAALNDIALDKIMKVEGRIVSLTVRPKAIQDAVIVMMLGQKNLRNCEYTTGAEILDGLRTTGGYMFSRIDKLMERIAAGGDVLITGEHRAKRYRMTNSGLAKARQIAQDLIALVP